MKKNNNTIYFFAVLLSINLLSCKNNQVMPTVDKPVETADVKELKQYYATTAKVNISIVNYDASKDEFSINGTAKISKTKLARFYELSKDNGQMIPIKTIAVKNK